jgi:hypothetical protein
MENINFTCNVCGTKHLIPHVNENKYEDIIEKSDESSSEEEEEEEEVMDINFTFHSLHERLKKNLNSSSSSSNNPSVQSIKSEKNDSVCSINNNYFEEEEEEKEEKGVDSYEIIKEIGRGK